ncbi:MAG TPA: nuclear transport factor 2 family protein [Kofleriaceae bacterium]|nr:nuclear transport factor 2 family protein [Kofleriaceae bacterium]
MLLLALVACHADPAPGGAARSAGAEVRARERAWLDAYEQRDPEVMADMLASGFLITFPDGGQMTRSKVIESTRRRAGVPGPRFETRGTVELERDRVVILVGQVIQTWTDDEGAPRREVSTYTDTWVREGSTWRVLASHLSRAPTR